MKKRGFNQQVKRTDIQGICRGAFPSTREYGYDDGSDMRGSKIVRGWRPFEFFLLPGFLL
jgi:hypothetical protein